MLAVSTRNLISTSCTTKKNGTDSPAKERMRERLEKKNIETKGRMKMEERTCRHGCKDWSFSAGKSGGGGGLLAESEIRKIAAWGFQKVC